MTSLEYWKERERAAAEEYAVQDEEALRRTQDVYLRLMASINDRINAFYARYAASEGITMNLAEMAVSQFDVKAFEATAAKMVADKDFSPQANAQLKIYNATMRINRLEMLKAYIGLDTIAAGEELVQLDESYLTERCREEFERQAGILGESIRPTRKDVDAIVHSSFYNATYSQRIWANMSELHDELSTILTNGIIQGINPRQMTSRMTERFNVSEYDAERLLRTEMARVQTETQRQSFQMAGFEYYVFISLEGRACPVCAALDTGEPIPLEDFMPGETAPPVHPNCRCSVAAWMDREQMEKELGFALDEEEAEETQKEEENAPTIAGVKKGNPMTVEEADTHNTNPLYKTGAVKYAINCQTCCPVYEARRRGYDIIAKGNTKGSKLEQLSRRTNLVWIDPKTGTHPEYLKDDTVTTAKKAYSWLETIVEPEARYTIQFSWKGRSRSGHIINMDRDENGEIRLLDNQRGEGEKNSWVGQNEVTAYLSRLKYTTSLYGTKYPTPPKVLRVDNLDFDYDFINDIAYPASEGV